MYAIVWATYEHVIIRNLIISTFFGSILQVHAIVQSCSFINRVVDELFVYAI